MCTTASSKRSYIDGFNKDVISLALRTPSEKGAANDIRISEGTVNLSVKVSLPRETVGLITERLCRNRLSARQLVVNALTAVPAESSTYTKI